MAETPSTIQPGTPLEDNLARINDNFKAIDDENRTKIIKDGDTPRVLIGYQKDGFGTGSDYGFKVSADGYDVTTATGTELAFSSAYINFKIVAKGSASITKAVNTSTASTAVAHGLGFTPAVTAFINAGGTYWQTPHTTLYSLATGEIANLLWVEVDSTNIYFKVNAPTQGGANPYYADAFSWPLTYYLYIETATV